MHFQYPSWPWRAITIGTVFVTVSLLAYTASVRLYSPNGGFSNGISKAQDLKYETPESSSRVLPDFCDDFDVSKIAFSIKTGATEPRNKIPTQLMTFFRCVPDVMIFSDLDQTLGSLQYHDVLTGFTKESTKYNPDFRLYWQQREYAEQGRETELLELSKIPIPYKDWRTAGKSAAWGLDKYKFLPMIKRAWDLQPERDWYVFIEADTYVSVSNLLRFLETQDPGQKRYYGNPVRMWEHEEPLMFGHGGSGFILSGATVRAFDAAYSSIATKFTAERVSKWWYGDFVVADALDEELKIRVTDAKPMINSDEPALLPFDAGVWCKPVVTLHHMDARGFDSMYKFQKARNFSELLFRDVYAATYTAGLPLKAESWDNLSDDQRYALMPGKNDLSRIGGGTSDKSLEDPNSSFKACQAACDQNGHCHQFSFITRMKRQDDGRLMEEPECHLSRVFHLGREVRLEEHEPGTKWDSGWLTKRIDRFIEDHSDCPDVNFGAPQG